MRDPQAEEDERIERQLQDHQDAEELEKFKKLLLSNELKTPNDLTVGMGEMVRKARESYGMSQADLAKHLNKRQATISDIENGKSEVGILTLAALAIVFDKPISYFFPESVLKDQISDVQSKFQHDINDLAKNIEQFHGDKEWALDLLKLVLDRSVSDFEENQY